LNFEAGSPNPIVPSKYITTFKTTIDLCSIQKSKTNFIIKLLIDTFENSTNVKVKCPMKEKNYGENRWLVDANKIIPKSIAFPANISIYGEFLAKTNSSSKRVFVFSVKLFLETKN
jgi:hypothetical protein